MKKCFKRFAQKVTALFFVLQLMSPIGPATAFTQEVEIEDLFDIASKLKVKTSTLSEVPLSKTPGTVSVLTADQIKDYGATTLDEVIALLPGVDVQMSPMGFAGNIRGFGGDPFQSGIQFLIDGLYYNSPDKGGSSANPGYGSFPIPVEMIKQVEVVREPISSLYGPNAYFGVINVIPKTGEDLKGGGSMSILASNRGSGRGVARYSALYGGNSGKWDWITSGEWFQQTGPVKFNENTRIRDSRLAGRVSYGDLVISWYNQVSDSKPFLWAGNNVLAKPTQQNVNLGGAVYEKDVTDTTSLYVKSGYIARFGTNCQVCHNPAFIKTSDPTDEREWFQRFSEEIRLTERAIDKHEITAGAEFIYDKEHMDSGVIDAASARPVKRTYSGFLQDVITLTDNFSTTIGIRQDSSGWSNVGPLTSPRILFVLGINDMTVARAGYTMAHRVPSFHEQQLFMKAFPRDAGFNSQTFFFGNPSIKPETIQTYNLGVDQWFGRNFLVKVNGFFSVVQNGIELKNVVESEVLQMFPSGLLPDGNPLPPAIRGHLWVNNPANAHIVGGELELHYKPIRRLDLTMNYAVKNISFTADTTPLLRAPDAPNAPKHKIGAGVTYYPIRNLMANVTGNFRSSFHPSFARQDLFIPGGVFDGKEALPSVFLLDFNVRYRFPVGISLSVLGRNILNQERKQFAEVQDTTLTGTDYFAKIEYEFGSN